MRKEYYTDEDVILRGKCSNPNHKEFVGDAVGCPECFAEQIAAESEEDTTDYPRGPLVMP